VTGSGALVAVAVAAAVYRDPGDLLDQLDDSPIRKFADS
jgi:hypothetical protein